MPINFTPQFRSRIHRFSREESGVVVVVVALGLIMLMGFAALAIDVGMLYRDRAQLQAKADVAALSIVPDFSDAQLRATRSLGQNAQDPNSLFDMQLGRFLRNPAIPKEDRFTPLPSGSAGINAVVLKLQDDSPLYFAQVFVDEDTTRINVKSTALRTGAASFTLGSHLIKLNETSLSQALDQSLGANIALSAGDIALLSSSTFSAGAFLDAVSTQIDFDALNPAEILDQPVPASDVIAALEAVLPAGLPSDLSGIEFSNALPTLTIRELVSGSATDLGLSTIDLLKETRTNAREVLAALANPGATGAPITLDVAASAPGILDLETQLSLGEPPVQSGVIAMGEVDVTLHSAAAKLRADVSVSPETLGTLAPGVEVTRLKLPLFTELAGASATLTELSCTGEDPNALAAKFETSQSELHPSNGASIAALYLGALPIDPMTTTAAIDPTTLDFADILDISITINVPLLPDIKLADITLQARSFVSVGQSQKETITFTKGDLASGRNKQSFGSGDLLETAVQSLLSPQNLELRTKPGQSGLDDTMVADVLSSVLNALPAALLANLLSPLDNVLDGMLRSLGVELGVGELTLTDHLCEVPKLVR